MTVTKPPAGMRELTGWAGSVPPAPVLTAPRNRRRPGLVAAAVVLVMFGGLGAWWGVQQSSSRVAVIGLARDVPWGQLITARDLVAVEVVPDPGLDMLAWSSASNAVGQRAATGLLAGMLLTARSVTTESVAGPGESVVGVTVKPSQAPTMELHPHDKIKLITIPDGADLQDLTLQSTVAGLDATVVSVSPVMSGGSRTVDVIVPEGNAGSVAGLGAAGRLAIVFVSRG